MEKLSKPNIKDNVCGIYCIVNKENGKRYVGKSKNIYKRMHQHRYDLIKGRSRNENNYLSASFIKYGIENFLYEVLEVCSIESCCERELYWMDYFDTNNKDKGYNIRRDSSSGMITSKETSDKISKRLRKEWSLGIRSGHGDKLKSNWSNNIERKELQSKVMTKVKTKYTYDVICESFYFTDASYKDLCLLGLKNVIGSFFSKKSDDVYYKNYRVIRRLL